LQVTEKLYYLVPVYLIVGSFLLPFYNLGICRVVFRPLLWFCHCFC